MAAGETTKRRHVMGTSEVRVNQLLRGRELDELLDRASAEKEMAKSLDPADALEVQAVYDIGSALWTVQVHNPARYPGASLYSPN